MPQLVPGPRGVKLRGPDERQVHAEGTVNGGTVQADEHAVRHRRPRRVFRHAVEAYLGLGYAIISKHQILSKYIQSKVQ